MTDFPPAMMPPYSPTKAVITSDRLLLRRAIPSDLEEREIVLFSDPASCWHNSLVSRTRPRVRTRLQSSFGKSLILMDQGKIIGCLMHPRFPDYLGVKYRMTATTWATRMTLKIGLVLGRHWDQVHNRDRQGTSGIRLSTRGLFAVLPPRRLLQSQSDLTYHSTVENKGHGILVREICIVRRSKPASDSATYM